MKKYITAAALLVAGATLSNAATALVHLSFNGRPTTDGVSLLNDGSRTDVTITKSSGFLNYNDQGLNFPSGDGYCFYTNESAKNYINISNAITWTSAWTASFAVQAADTTAWHNMFSIGSGWLRIQNATDGTTETAIGVYSSNSGISWTNGQSDFTLSGSSFKVITMTYDVVGETSSFKVYGDGALVSSLEIASSELTSVGTMISLGGNAGNGNPYYSYYDEFAIYDEALTAEQISENLVGKAAPLSISAVPEPSAFGLLAGAGALALVAARRRRRAK